MTNIMVEGTDGIIIIDAGETNEQAQQALSEFHRLRINQLLLVIYTQPTVFDSFSNFIYYMK